MKTSERAIVIGSGIAGLLATRVLADRFGEVTLFERDAVTPETGVRRSVPQGAHSHLLLKRGEDVIERLFPGIGAELDRRGAVLSDVAAGARWLHHGVWKLRFDSGIHTHKQSRPLLERVMRARVEAMPGVTVRHGASVRELCATPDRARVTGVIAEGGTGRWTGDADLVVDASGRGSRLPQWLSALGYPPPPEDRLEIDLRYATRHYRRPAGAADWRSLIVYPDPPTHTRGGIIVPVEDDGWVVTVFGYHRDHPPGDNDGYLQFARGLPSPELYEAVRTAQPLTDVSVLSDPRAVWRRYDRADRFPAGVLAIGDSFCSTDPVFGQGMTMAAQGADLLGAMLPSYPGGRSAGSAVQASWRRRYFRRLAGRVSRAWQTAGLEDLRYPQTAGPRPRLTAAFQWYTDAVIRATAADTHVFRHYLRTVHHLAGPMNLLRPSVLLRVLARVALDPRCRRRRP